MTACFEAEEEDDTRNLIWQPTVNQRLQREQWKSPRMILGARVILQGQSTEPQSKNLQPFEVILWKNS